MAGAFLELARTRRSVRRYRPGPVEREKILACLEAARLAPSAENVQPWRFLVVDDPDLKASLGEAAFRGIYAVSKFAARAPVLVVVLARPGLTAVLGGSVRGVPFHVLDLGIAGEHFVLQAHELGLGTCWIGWFDARAVRKRLRIPKAYRIVALLALGYAADPPPHPRPRKALAEIAWFNELGREGTEHSPAGAAESPGAEE